MKKPNERKKDNEDLIRRMRQGQLPDQPGSQCLSSGTKRTKRDPKLMAKVYGNLKARDSHFDNMIDEDVRSFQTLGVAYEVSLLTLAAHRRYSDEETALLIQRLVAVGMRLK